GHLSFWIGVDSMNHEPHTPFNDRHPMWNKLLEDGWSEQVMKLAGWIENSPEVYHVFIRPHVENHDYSQINQIEITVLHDMRADEVADFDAALVAYLAESCGSAMLSTDMSQPSRPGK